MASAYRCGVSYEEETVTSKAKPSAARALTVTPMTSGNLRIVASADWDAPENPAWAMINMASTQFGIHVMSGILPQSMVPGPRMAWRRDCAVVWSIFNIAGLEPAAPSRHLRLCIECYRIQPAGGCLNRWNDSLATVTDQESIDRAIENLASVGWDIGRHVGHKSEQRKGNPVVLHRLEEMAWALPAR